MADPVKTLKALTTYFSDPGHHLDEDDKHVSVEELRSAKGLLGKEADEVIDALTGSAANYGRLAGMQKEGLFNDPQVSLRDLHAVVRGTGYAGESTVGKRSGLFGGLAASAAASSSDLRRIFRLFDESHDIVIDDKTKTVNVCAHFVFWGGAGSQAVAEDIVNDIANAWNQPAGTIRYQGQEYKVRFHLSGYYDGAAQESDVAQNTDVRKKFINITEANSIGGSFVNELRSSRGQFVLKQVKDPGSTTESHEYGHMLGLDHPNGDQRHEGVPRMMAPRGTLVDSEFQWAPDARAGQGGGTLNPAHRQVKAAEFQELEKVIEKLDFDVRKRGCLSKL